MLPERRAIEHIATPLVRRFATAVTRLEKGWQAFCELRDVLQLSNAELPRADLRAHQRELAPPGSAPVGAGQPGT